MVITAYCLSTDQRKCVWLPTVWDSGARSPWVPQPHAGAGVVRIDPLRFLVGCCTRRLIQVLSVLSLSLPRCLLFIMSNHTWSTTQRNKKTHIKLKIKNDSMQQYPCWVLNMLYYIHVVLLTRVFFMLCCICVYVFCLLVVLVRLSVPVQVTDWKDSSPKWPTMCRWGR